MLNSFHQTEYHAAAGGDSYPTLALAMPLTVSLAPFRMHFASINTAYECTYIKALRSVLIDMLAMGCTTARNRSRDINTKV